MRRDTESPSSGGSSTEVGNELFVGGRHLPAIIPRIVETRQQKVSTQGETGVSACFYNPPMGRPRKVGGQPKKDFAVKVGKRIEKAMHEKKWGLKELAAKTGYLVGTIGMWITGARLPGPEQVRKIADVTGESPAWLMGLADDKKPDTARNSEEAALLQLYRTVDPEDRKKTIDRLGALALLKKEAIEDAKLLDNNYSAKGKPLVDTAGAPMAAPRRERSKAKRGG